MMYSQTMGQPGRRRRHHFISQFYLKGFTDENGKIWMHDVRKLTSTHNHPQAIAYETDLNTVYVPGVKPDEIEDRISKFEAIVAPIFEKTIATETLPKGEELFRILEFVALSFARTPTMRRVVDASIVAQDGDVDWTKVPKLADQTYQVSHMVDLWQDTVQAIVKRRYWQLVKVPVEIGSLVLSDNPVHRQWMFEEDLKYGYATFRALRTWLYMPFSKQLLLVGTFEPVTAHPVDSLRLLADMNTLCLRGIVRHAFSSDRKFVWIAENERILSGEHFLGMFGALNCIRGIDAAYSKCPQFGTAKIAPVNLSEYLKRHRRLNNQQINDIFDHLFRKPAQRQP